MHFLIFKLICPLPKTIPKMSDFEAINLKEGKVMLHILQEYLFHNMSIKMFFFNVIIFMLA